jgi:hypothetical protein
LEKRNPVLRRCAKRFVQAALWCYQLGRHSNSLTAELSLSKSMVHQDLGELEQRALFQQHARAFGSILWICTTRGIDVAKRLEHWTEPLAQLLNDLSSDRAAVIVDAFAGLCSSMSDRPDKPTQ